jgi:elongator complex protein 4
VIRICEHLSDAVIEIESFQGSPHPVNPAYTTDYNGLIHVNKLYRDGSRRLGNVYLHSLGFKVRRKRFEIQTFHLPPEDAADNTKTNGCGSLDF